MTLQNYNIHFIAHRKCFVNIVNSVLFMGVNPDHYSLNTSIRDLAATHRSK